MRRFLLHITAYLVLFLLVMGALDLAYTYVYAQSKPRSKFQYFRSLSHQHFDYAFLGSSRVDNSIVPSVIQNETGKTAVNLGIEASKPQDIFTMLQLLEAYRIETKTVYAQIDYIYNTNGNSNILAYEMMPFLRENEVTKAHFSFLANRDALYYVPFYRYCQYDQKLGIREVFFNLISKKTSVADDFGFTPLHGQWTNWRDELPTAIATHNGTIDSMRAWASTHRRELKFFCAPFDRRTKNQEFTGLLKAKLPDLLDYSKAVPESSLFANYFHLNEEGACAFTALFSTTELQKKAP